MKRSNKSIQPSEYSKIYYHNCEGYETFKKSHGTSIPARLKIPLRIAELHPGMKVIDIGCGRGEILLQAAKNRVQVWGIDYSKSAVSISNNNLLKILETEYLSYLLIIQGNAIFLPFKTGSVDRVLMLDVVEHLTKEEFLIALSEAHRVLQPGGKLIIHTMPNLWYYRFGYPLFRLIQKLRKISLPVDPHDRSKYHHLHINEQTIISLQKALNKAGFSSKTWLQNIQKYNGEDYSGIKVFINMLVTIYPFRWFFCNDIFAVGTR